MARTDPQVNLRFPAELKEAIDQAAKDSGRSMNAEIVARLQESFAQSEEVHTLQGEIASHRVAEVAWQNEIFKAKALLERQERQVHRLKKELEWARTTLYVLLDSDGRPTSWAEIEEILRAIRAAGRFSPHAINTAVVTPDMVESSDRAKEAASLAKELRTKGKSMLLEAVGPAESLGGIDDLAKPKRGGRK